MSIDLNFSNETMSIVSVSLNQKFDSHLKKRADGRYNALTGRSSVVARRSGVEPCFM
jgi:hypothetical protein